MLSDFAVRAHSTQAEKDTIEERLHQGRVEKARTLLALKAHAECPLPVRTAPP